MVQRETRLIGADARQQQGSRAAIIDSLRILSSQELEAASTSRKTEREVKGQVESNICSVHERHYTPRI